MPANSATKASYSNEDIAKNKLVSTISYLGILVVPTILAKNSPFAHFHVKQSLVLLVCKLISLVLFVFPFLYPILLLGQIILFFLMIVGIINAASGAVKDLLIGGKYAQKINL